MMTILTIEVDADLSEEQVQQLQEGIVYNLNGMLDTLGAEAICPELNGVTNEAMEQALRMHGRFPFHEVEE